MSANPKTSSAGFVDHGRKRGESRGGIAIGTYARLQHGVDAEPWLARTHQSGRCRLDNESPARGPPSGQAFQPRISCPRYRWRVGMDAVKRIASPGRQGTGSQLVWLHRGYRRLQEVGRSTPRESGTDAVSVPGSSQTSALLQGSTGARADRFGGLRFGGNVDSTIETIE